MTLPIIVKDNRLKKDARPALRAECENTYSSPSSLLDVVVMVDSEVFSASVVCFGEVVEVVGSEIVVDVVSSGVVVEVVGS